MSDNVTFQTSVTATPPNATTVATDNIGGAHYQQVKLVFGNDGTAFVVSDGTPLPVLGTVQPLAGSVHLASGLPGTVQALGTVQTHGTSQMLGTVQPLAGSVHLASGLPGTVQALGSVQTVGTSQVLGTIQPLAGSVHLANTVSGTVQTHGTSQIIGTVQPLAGSVHIANAITVAQGTIPGGTVVAQPLPTGAGTYMVVRLTDGASFYNASGGGGGGASAVDQAAFSAGVTTVAPMAGISTITAIGQGSIGALAMDSNRVLYVRGTVDGGTVQTHGTSQVLGTVQPLAGSVHLASGLPGTVQALGSVQTVGTSQVLGTIQPLAGSVHLANTVSGTVQTHGTSQVLGSVQTVGTSQVLGTVQPLAGSVHLASGLPGTVFVVGSASHSGPNQVLIVPIGAIGSSGAPAAVSQGSAVRLWADQSGRLQVRGTVDSVLGTVQALGSVQTVGTSQVLGTIQPLAGSVHLANTVSGTVQTHGTSQALGTVQPLAGSVHVANTIPGTVQVLGSVQTVGTSQALGTVQPLAGSVHVANTVSGTVQTHGTSQVLGTIATRTVAPILENAFGTVFTAAVTNGTLVPAAGQGTYVRVWDVMVSGSAAGSAFLELGNGTPFGHVFNAAQGGFALNSARGIRTPGTNVDVLFNCSAGSWGVSINYTLET